ncbi:MAG TPA: magnesium transporter [Humisphaera sp.]|jgi:magnesium transporter|nr:magnesium transporter [Humisphaera sp.]
MPVERPRLTTEEKSRIAADAAEAHSADVAHRIEEIPAADGADVLEGLSSGAAADVAEYLDPETAGRILSEMEPERAASVLRDMEPPEASMVVSAMDPDDAVDVLERLPAGAHDAIVKELEPEDADEMRRLEQYAPDTAGGIMTPQVTALVEDLTVEQAIGELRRISEQLEQMFYVYVIDRRRHLIGVLSMRDLILSRPEKKLSQIMRTGVARVPATMDQEAVALLMRRHGYLALPVVDDQNRLLGIITVDDVVDVMEEEATEDVQKMFGAGAEERLSSPWTYSFRKRIGWLEVNLLTAFMAAWVISWFDNTISALPVLAAYQSIVSGMGGNAGAQALAVAIRGMALGEGGGGILLRVMRREAKIGLLAGITIGLTTAIPAALGVFGGHDHPYNPYILSAVIGASLTLNHVLACTTGVTIPFLMRGLGFDPAQSATVWATTVTDCCGFFSTLGIAYLCMPLLTGHH